MNKLRMICKIISDRILAPCSHPAVNQFNPKGYCPDCGKRIKVNWITVRCQQCKSLMMSKIDEFGNIRPLKRFCTDCGSDRWFSRTSSNISISESLYAILLKEEDELRHNTSSTNVWVEKPEGKKGIKPGKNIIKARKSG